MTEFQNLDCRRCGCIVRDREFFERNDAQQTGIYCICTPPHRSEIRNPDADGTVQ
jgi:hypothetical protein